MILLTGGTGLLGSTIIKELHSCGYTIRALVRSYSVEKTKILNAEIALGDLRDPASLQRATQNVTGIIHTATTEPDTQEEVDIETRAMKVLLESWDKGPFVYISSADVYGYPKTSPINEDFPLKPAKFYGKGKVACETLLTEAASQKGRRDFSILRPPNIWSPNPSCLKYSLKSFVSKIRNNQRVTLFGENYGDAWIDARELAWIAVECLNKPISCAANAVNSHFTWYEVCQELIHITGSSSQIVLEETKEEQEFYAQTWSYSSELLKERIQFQPRYRWQDALAEAVKSSNNNL